MLFPRDRTTLIALLITAVVSAALVLWMVDLRQDVLGPEWVPIFLSLFVFQDYAAALLTVLILLLGLVRPLQRAGISLAVWLGANPLLAAAVACLGLSLGAIFAYHNYPLSMDEYAGFFQSQVFAAGKLTGQFPADIVDWLVPEPFQNFFLDVSKSSGKVSSKYWPGFALLLTPFTAVGVPWLCNPVIGALTLIVLHRSAFELFENRAGAGIAVLFALASPAFTVNAISYYSMPAHLLCSATYFLLMLRPSPQRAFCAGLIGSLALTLHNPVPHFLFALPWVVWLITRHDRMRLILPLAAGYVPVSLLLGVGWSLFVDSTLGNTAVESSAQIALWKKPISLLTGVLSWPSEATLFARAIGLAKVWLWAAPLLAVLACIGLWRWRVDVRVRLLAWSAIATFVGYLFVPFDQGHGWGFRYFHSVWLVLPILGAAALVPRTRVTEASAPPDDARRELAGVTVACALGSLVLATGLRLYQVEHFIARHLQQIPTSALGTPEVIVVTTSMGYYAIDLIHNDPFLRHKPVLLVSRGRHRDREMMEISYPGLVLLHRDYRGTVWGTP